MSKPIWLLDVDGVLNALGKESVRMEYRDTWIQEECNGYTITYSPDLVAQIQELVDADKVEVRWLTTWWNDIEKLPFVEWHSWPVANTASQFRSTRFNWWKLPVAMDTYVPGEKLIWTDDDIFYDQTARNWVANNPDILAVGPSPAIGLTDASMNKIRKFLNA